MIGADKAARPKSHMIAATQPASQTNAPTQLQPARWQQAMAGAITDPAELLRLLGLDPTTLPAAGAHAFAMRVPRGFAARMRRSDLNDPLLRQVLPIAAESNEVAGYVNDPVGDLASRAGPGLLHKYHGRALVIATGACAVHCRYCFRRHFPYSAEQATGSNWEQALDALRADSTIEEIILSGGDPLSLSDRRLAALTDTLQAIPHIKRLRVHTRQPVVLPERVDDGLLRWLDSVHLQKVLVLHVNHANEIDQSVRDACENLLTHNVTLLNQAVLLAGVNDSVAALRDLSEALLSARVLPYYLHLLDPVQGAAHFHVARERAIALIDELTTVLPGYLVPKLVCEEPGAPAKSRVI